MTPRTAALALLCAGTLAACGDDPTYLTRAQLLDVETCKKCHPDHVSEWSTSMHAYASDDPLFLAMNQRGQRETGGTLGDFCVKCHAPMAVAEGVTHDGLNLASVPQKLKGVTCYFCHTVDAVTGTHNNPLGLSKDGITMRGEYADPVQNSAHKATYSTLHDRDQAASATLCGSCHDIVSPAGGAIERTFTEWHDSVFSRTGGNSCSQCHMDQSHTRRPIAMAPGVFARYYHSHLFPAVDVALTPGLPGQDTQRSAVDALLKTTLQSALCVVNYASASGLRVILDAVGTGHDFPSGSAQDRRLWTEVIAYKGGQVLYQSGVVPGGTPPTHNPDADFWMIRDCMFDGQGGKVDMFWQAVSFESNLLPAQLTFDPLDPRYYQSHILQSFPRDPSMHIADLPDRVTLRVRLQPVGLDVLDDLIGSGDLDPQVRSMMPTYDLDLGAGPALEWTMAKAKLGWLEQDAFPVYCVTDSNLNIAAQTVPAPNHTKCTP
jgi:nitrate/TMAO reductase-like tetraheme cytochrome c subunit